LIPAVQDLPIDPLLPEIATASTRHQCLVLRAPPGAGKTTRVPAALLDGGLCGGRDVVVLEPRRIAARAAAEFVAQERGGTVGGEVGYRVRFEQRGGPHTRLWFVTEGVFARQLIADPLLDRVGVVVLDEFHERHLQQDVALAVVRELQQSVRTDLRLVVMSATLDTERLAGALGDAVVLTSEGRSHPVDIEYEDRPAPDRRLAGRVTAALGRLLSDEPRATGDILVFLPGAGEIRRAAEAIEELAARHDLDVVTLHGDQPLEAQRRALRPASRRRVVLSTNVAETALTVEGVTTVIDSGLARIARFDARHGINALRVAPISRAAADQRAGRAGRLAPGRCVRLWTRVEHDSRRPHETPEILRLDLTRIILELRGWGLERPSTLAWLDPPPPGMLESAEALLAQLGAVDVTTGHLTTAGRRMLELPVAPRIAAMLAEAERLERAHAGALMAALASERDICVEGRALTRGDGGGRWPAGPSDLLLRMDLFEQATRRGLDAAACGELGLDVTAVRTVDRARRQLSRLLAPVDQPARRRSGGTGTRAHDPGDADTLLRCVLAGFPDRVARRRGPGSSRALMVGGRGLLLSEHSIVRDAELFVAIDVERVVDRGVSEARVRLASAVHREWLAERFPDAVRETTEVVFDAAQERVVERTRVTFHDLVLGERAHAEVDPMRAGQVLAAVARADPSRVAGIGRAEQILARVAFLSGALPELHLPTDRSALLADAVTALCAGRRSFAELRAADALGALRRRLDATQLAALDREAPTEIALPSGRRAPVVYEPGKPPVVAARIQELFGLTRSPRLARGRIAVLIEVLAPNQRPVQITDDLESFWRTTYADVRKQLRGRYPKHDWPEDPLTAAPSSRPRPRRR
jgi:ATP-dependent helicase HrpB